MRSLVILLSTLSISVLPKCQGTRTLGPWSNLTEEDAYETLLLIGGKSSDNDFVNDVQAVGIKDCPKIKHLPDIEHINLKTLSTLTEDGYLIICSEHKVIACHSKAVQEEKEIDMPEMIYETAPRNVSM